MHTIISRPGDLNRAEQLSFIRSVTESSDCLEDIECPDGGTLSLYRDREGTCVVLYFRQGYLRAGITNSIGDARELFGFLRLIHQA
jgi:hypothetical protein|nr:MAG TPA: hypothetical protein [Caudoviricetes sp.]